VALLKLACSLLESKPHKLLGELVALLLQRCSVQTAYLFEKFSPFHSFTARLTNRVSGQKGGRTMTLSLL